MFAGSCQQNRHGNGHWNAGLANSALTYADGRLFLNYTGGAPCHGGLYERSTIIEFVCGDRVRPEFVHEDAECNYWFRFDTTLACEHRVSDVTRSYRL